MKWLKRTVTRGSLAVLAVLLGALAVSGCGSPVPTKPGESVHPAHVISGTVQDAEQHPIAKARVYLTSGPSPFPEIAALTDEAGRFALSVPAPGTYTLECSADGYATAAKSIQVTGSQEIELELQKR